MVEIPTSNFRMGCQFVFLLLLFLPSLQAVKYLGCYSEVGRERHFAINPGIYKPEQLTHQMCIEACKAEKYPLAGTTEGRYCFCAEQLSNLKTVSDNECSTNCTGNSSSKCGGARHVTVHEIQIDIEGLSIVPTNDGNLEAEKEQQIDFKMVKGPASPKLAISYRPDGEDGVRMSKVFQSRTTKAVILTSGFHKVTGHAFKDDGINNTENYTELVFVSVPVGEIQIKCPLFTKPDSEIMCNITAKDGTRMNISVKYGDGQSEEFPIADAVRTAIGPAVYPEDNLAVSATMSGNTIIRKGQIISNAGFIKAIEYFATKNGDINIYVMEPECSGSQVFCHGKCVSQPCSALPSVTCGSGEVFCPFKDVCVSSSNMKSCPAASPTVHKQYRVRNSARITVQASGYQQRTDLNVEVKKYDVIAFGSGGGILAKIPGAKDIDVLLGNSVSVGDLSNTSTATPTESLAARLVVATPSKVRIYHEYKSGGSKSVEVTVKNTLINSSKTANATVTVHPYINSTMFKAPSAVWTGSNVTFELLPNTGELTKKSWNFGGTIVNTTTMAVQHSFSSTGKIKVCVTISNKIDNGSDCTFITVQNAVDGQFRLTSNTPVFYPPGHGTITLTRLGGSPLPTDATVTCLWGDGTANGSKSVNGNTVALTHTFSPRRVVVQCTVYNSVSLKKFSTQVDIIEKIVIEEVTTRHVTPSGAYTTGGGPARNQHPVDLPINIIVKMKSGIASRFEYTIEAPDGSKVSDTSSTSPFSYTSKQDGTHKITINASDAYSSDVGNTTVILSHGVSGVQITDDDIVTDVGQMKNLTVTFTSLGPSTCCRVNFSDNEPLVAYGFDAILCTSENKPEFGNFLSYSQYKEPLTNPMIFQRVYNDNRPYVFTIFCYDSGTPGSIGITKSLPFSVSRSQCKRPNITIIDAVPTINDAPTILSKDPVEIVGHVISITCPERLQGLINNKKSWYIWKLPEKTTEVPVEMKHLRQDGFVHTTLYLQKESLRPGLYKIVFRVAMEGRKDLENFYSETETYLKIGRSPLIAGFLPASVSSIDLGRGQSLFLNSRKYTKDPDDPEKRRRPRCQFYCRRLTGNTTLSTAIEYALSQGNIKATLDPMVAMLKYNDGESCFRSNAGLVSRACIAKVTRSHVKGGYRYLYVMNVTKDVRSDVAMVIINAVEHAAPIVYFRCPNSAIAVHSSSSSLLVNTGHDLPLEAICLTGCHSSDVITYKWLLQQQTGTNSWQTLTDSDSFISGQETHKTSISKALFSNNTILGKGNLRIKLETTSKLRGMGKVTTRLLINRPPEGGTCTIFPLETEFLQQTFTSNCTGWKDPEKEEVKSYQFFVRADGETYDTPIGTSKTGYLESPLLMGPAPRDHSIEVYCVISDPLQATTRVVVGNVKVRPVGLAKAQTYLENATKLLPEGNEKDVLNALYNLGMVLNYARAISLKESLITNLTRFTSLYNISKPENLTEEQYQAGRNNRSVIRKQLVDKLTLVNPHSLDSITLVTTSADLLATTPEEMGRTMQRKVVNYMDKITKSLKPMENSSTPEEQEDNIIRILRTVSNTETACALSVTDPVQEDIDEVDTETMEYDTDPMSEDPNHDDQTNLTLATGNLQGDISNDLTRQNCSNNRKTSQSIIDAISQILARPLPRNKDRRVILPHYQVLVKKAKASNLSGTFTTGEDQAVVPSIDKLTNLPPNVTNEDVNVVMATASADLYVFSRTSDKFHLAYGNKLVSLQLSLAGSNLPLPVNNASKGIVITIPHHTNATNLTFTNVSTYMNSSHPKFIYHQVTIRTNQAILAEIYPTDGNYSRQYLVLLGREYLPTTEKFSAWSIAEEYPVGSKRIVAFWDNTFFEQHNGEVFLGLRELTNSTLAKALKDAPGDVKLIRDITTNANFTSNYYIRTQGLSCTYWDTKREKWSTEGVIVLRESNSNATICETKHLTSFAGGWIVQPNKINWTLVFTKADFMSNPTLYATQIVILVIFILGAIWARYKDSKDKEKVGVVPLPDNDPRDKYLYELIVSTGFRRGGGTDSKVFCIITGEFEETEVRSLANEKRQLFRRGHTDLFLLSTPRPLGDLFYIHIWHDASGKGEHQSWFLNHMLIRDVQTGQKWVFLCNRWLALEQDDGLIERVLPAASQEELTEFSHVFAKKTLRDMADGHLWFSVLNRPPTSRFTRLQRLSCCLCLLYTMMLTNAMFYERAETATSVFTIGPFALSPEQISIGIMSNLIVFPVNFFIIWLFRKSRPRKLQQNRIRVALEVARKKLQETAKQHEDNQEDDISQTDPLSADQHIDQQEDQPMIRQQLSDLTIDSLDEKINSLYRQANFMSHEDSRRSRISPNEELPNYDIHKPQKPFYLPWWCLVIAWILLWMVVGVCFAFVTFYGVSFQEAKCQKWISSLLISVVTSMLFTQPIKVIMVAAFISLVCKRKTKIEEDELLVDEEEDMGLEDNQIWLNCPRGVKFNRPSRPPPLDRNILQKAREKRIKELQMMDVLREIAFYFTFLWILMVVSYSLRDPNAFNIKEQLTRIFITPSSHGGMDLAEVNSPATAWDWMKQTLVPGLRANRWYNNRLPFGQRGFISDRVSRIMGFATIRQLRVKSDSNCVVPKGVKRWYGKCDDGYSLITQEQGHFDAEWKSQSNTTAFRSKDCEWKHHPYCFRHWRQLNGYPYFGKHTVYSGSGYVIKLRGRVSKMLRELDDLHKQTWLDSSTRAVFVEFTIYNAFVNVFGIVTIVMEVLPTGGYDVSYRIEPVNLLQYFTSAMLFQIVCDLAFMAFVIFFMVKEIRKLRKARWAYFRELWNWAEMGVITLSLIGMMIFFYRLYVANGLVKAFKHSHGNAYMKFQYVGYWNELLMYDIGWLCFLATLKFLRVLRFNKKMSMLAETLRDSGKHLLSFSFMFAVIFMAFVFLFLFTFGSTLKEYSNLLVCSESLLNMMLGVFDFDQIRTLQPVLGPLFFIIFIGVISFIILNMFISILNDSFAAVKDDLAKRANDYEIVDFMVERMKAMVGLNYHKAPPEGEMTPGDNGENYDQLADNPVVDKIEKFIQYNRIEQFLDTVSYLYFEKQAISMSKYNVPLMKNLQKQMNYIYHKKHMKF